MGDLDHPGPNPTRVASANNRWLYTEIRRKRIYIAKCDACRRPAVAIGRCALHASRARRQHA